MLDGTAFNGQHITINLPFANGEFIRLYTASGKDKSLLSLGWVFPAGGVSVPIVNGFPVNTLSFSATVTLLGAAGPLPLRVLPIYTYTGGSEAQLSELIVDDIPSQRVSQLGTLPLDFYGFKIDLTLPNSTGSFMDTNIIDGEFGVTNNKVFGVGPGIPSDIVPDSGSTLWFLCGAVLLLVGIKRCASRPFPLSG